jgi:ssRNA-specific RNase YbeY (16S rRNA maturation enzyme)
VYISRDEDTVQVTLLDGSYLKDENDSWITLSKKADVITIKKERDAIDYQIRGDPNLHGDIFKQPLDSTKIEKETNSIEQPKNTEQRTTVVTKIPGAASEDTIDMEAVFENFVKKILSVFSSI